jgi:hypothetical protein
VQFEVIGQHAEKDVGAHAQAVTMKDRADVEVGGFERAKGAFDPAEALVSGDGCGIVEPVGGHRGTQRIKTVAADAGDAAQRPPGAADRFPDRDEGALGGLQQILALARPFGRQGWIAVGGGREARGFGDIGGARCEGGGGYWSGSERRLRRGVRGRRGAVCCCSASSCWRRSR